MKKKSILLLPILLFSMAALCQQPTKADLERQRTAIQRDIDEVKALLAQTAKNKKATLGQLALVQKKLRLRMAAINNINKQINLIEGDIYQSSRDISKLRKELDTLKLQYEKSVVYAYKNRSNYDFLNFLFSSTSFNDALKRVAYLRSYRNYREQQASTIRNTQEALKQKIAGLNENKKKKGEALTEENKQRGVLEEEKNEKSEVISSLKSREKELNKELAAKRKRDQRLTAAINEAVRKAREEAIREAKAAAAAKKEAAAKAATTKPNTPSSAPAITTTKPATKPKSVFASTPEGELISDNFEKNRGKLPWPVDKGDIKIHFGAYRIEELNITGNNPGLTIETEEGAPIKAIFDGEVKSVVNIGQGQTVIMQHGKYFSAYSNLSSANVSKNQKVTAGQVIGKAGTNDDNNGEIEFVLMQDTRNIDPEQWIRRR